MQLCAPKLRPLSMHGRRESAHTEHVWMERERACSREFSATAVSRSDSRGRERGRMNREECAGGEVGGRAREWRVFFRWRRIHFGSRPTCQIQIMIIPFPMLELSLNPSPLGSFVFFFSILNLYTVTVNV